jgi:hypothetical protein
MTIVSLAVLVSMSAQLALSLKVISIQLIQTLAQSVVLVQMFVHLKLFIQNKYNQRNEKEKARQICRAFFLWLRSLITSTMLMLP